MGGSDRGARPMFNVTKRATQGFKPSGGDRGGGGGVPFLMKEAVEGGVVAASLYFLSQRQSGKDDGSKAAVSPSGAEKHEKKDVNAVLQVTKKNARAAHSLTRCSLGFHPFSRPTASCLINTATLQLPSHTDRCCDSISACPSPFEPRLDTLTKHVLCRSSQLRRPSCARPCRIL